MTPERFKRIKSVLARRQLDLTVLMENVHKPHNLSAIVRSCDAVGVHEIHAVSYLPALRTRKNPASGASQWVKIKTHSDLSNAGSYLKSQNMQILAAHPTRDAIDFREVDYTRPTAILLGQELDGITDVGLALADQHIVIPMLGMVESLNVSVAAALILFEAQRQRQLVGLYDHVHLAQHIFESTLFEWAHPKLAKFYQSKGLDYPDMDEDGNVLETVEHRQARLSSHSR